MTRERQDRNKVNRKGRVYMCNMHHTSKEYTKEGRDGPQRSTSMLSDKVWREMRKQLAGRGQHDGVT